MFNFGIREQGLLCSVPLTLINNCIYKAFDLEVVLLEAKNPVARVGLEVEAIYALYVLVIAQILLQSLKVMPTCFTDITMLSACP